MSAPHDEAETVRALIAEQTGRAVTAEEKAALFEMFPPTVMGYDVAAGLALEIDQQFVTVMTFGGSVTVRLEPAQTRLLLAMVANWIHEHPELKNARWAHA